MYDKRFGWAAAAALVTTVCLVLAGIIVHNITLIVIAMLFAVIFAPQEAYRMAAGTPDERERGIGDRAAYHALFAFVGIAVIAGTSMILLVDDAFLRTLGLTINLVAMEAIMLFCLFVAYLAEYRYRASRVGFVLLAALLAVLPIAGAVWFVLDAYPAASALLNAAA